MKEVNIGDIISPVDDSSIKHEVVESLRVDMRRGVISLKNARKFIEIGSAVRVYDSQKDVWLC